MSAITHQPLTLWRGEYRAWDITITADDTGEREDLSSAVAVEFQVKAAVGGADPPLLFKSVGSGITVLAQSGDTMGQARLVLLPADTIALAAGVYWYDIVVEFPGSIRRYVVKPNKLTLRGVVNPP